MVREEEPWSLVIGRVTAPFGTKGAVRVRPETDFPERFGDLEQVCLELRTGEERLFQVQGTRLTAKGILLTVAGCTDRDQAGELRRAWVKVKPSMAVPLPQGSYWVHDIVGLRAVTPEGEDLGEVTEVLRTPANDVYVTDSAMIPALRQVVREIDLQKRRMIVSLPAGESSQEDRE